MGYACMLLINDNIVGATSERQGETDLPSPPNEGTSTTAESLGSQLRFGHILVILAAKSVQNSAQGCRLYFSLLSALKIGSKLLQIGARRSNEA